MKKIFTLIAAAVMAVTASAETYTLDNQASTYVIVEGGTASTYTMDGVEGFAVNTEGGTQMTLALAANQNIYFTYSNSSSKTPAVKTGANFMQCDSKNFVINVPLEADEMVIVKFSAKGSAPQLGLYGSSTTENCTTTDDSQSTCSGKSIDDAVEFKAVASKKCTAQIKETANGMRIYSITIGTATGISDIDAPAETTGKKITKVAKNGQLTIGNYNIAGQRIK